ncbi:mucoidy inhibitor MuiA family protein [Lacihabitans lacunae]|uniref:Mucoidy inhibitor MuiA family protein n=1 Tax=Lacihabitans lacunae TaxID=1028214 RepID=A0ABV7Z0A8_9BACT
MKKLILALLVPFVSFGQTKIDSKVAVVVIFTSGAQVKREATIDLKNGENSFIIKGVSPELDKNSIQISFSDPAITINSLSHQLSLNNEQDFKELNTKIQAKNTAILNEKSKIALEEKLLNYEEKLLLNNQNVGGTYSGMKPEDLIKTVDYFESKMKKILKSKYVLEQKVDSLDAEIRENNRALNILSLNKENKLSEIRFALNSKQTINNLKVTISYFLKNAGWSPIYDFNAKSLNQPITVVYKSKIYQYSGEDWKNVKVTLSNSIPKKNSKLPDLKTWIWGYPNDYSKYLNDNTDIQKQNEVWGTIKDANGDLIPGASVVLEGTSLGVASDMNGMFRLSIPADRVSMSNSIRISFVGYVTQTVAAANSPIEVTLKEDSQALQEVVVMGYSPQVRKNATGSVSVPELLAGRAAGVSVSGNKAISIKSLIEEKENPVSMEFSFKENLTLESDGKEKNFDLKEIEIPAEYVYKSIPKIEPAAFLTANILDWEKFNFLPGEANLYFEGTYVGKSNLDLSNTDTLTISLGRDPSIIVDRKQVKSYSKKQVLGQNINSNYGYDISVRNTKNQEIKISIEDQFPISSNKVIEVSDQKAPQAKIEETTGKITWDLNIPKASEKNLSLTYSVKYPKN